MRKLICLLALLGLTGVAYAQEEGQTEEKQPEAQKDDESQRDPKALEILKKVDETTKKVEAVSYDAELKVTGPGTPAGANVKGSVVFTGIDGRTPAKFHIKAELTDSSESKPFIIGGNGDMFFLIDHDAKMVYEDLDPSVLGTRGGRAMALAMIEFTYPAPFSDELNGKVVELKGEEKIGDVDCHKIYVQYSQQTNQSATWYFSKKDFLPRGVERVFTGRDGSKRSNLLKISNLKPDPKIDESLFQAVVPEGYTKTDDFAP